MRGELPTLIPTKDKNRQNYLVSLCDFPLPFVTKDQVDVAFILGDEVSSSEPYTHARVCDGAVVGFLTIALSMGEKNIWRPEVLPRFVVGPLLPNINIVASEHNIVVIGSPKVNSVSRWINDHVDVKFRLPMCRSFNVQSLSKDFEDSDYPQSSLGTAYLSRNPYNDAKYALVVAGCHALGTWAAGHALASKLTEIKEKKTQMGIVTIGVDEDNDGVQDDSRIIAHF